MFSSLFSINRRRSHHACHDGKPGRRAAPSLVATAVEAEKNTGPHWHRSWGEHHEIQEGSRARGDHSDANENENEGGLAAAIHKQAFKKTCFKTYTETEQQLERVKEKKNKRQDNDHDKKVDCARAALALMWRGREAPLS